MFTPQEIQDIRDWVSAASKRSEVRNAVGQIYQQVEQEIALRRPLCVMSGKCCRFDEYGHRLYVTTLELGAFSYELAKFAAKPPTGADKGVCPFQSGKLCGVHSIRPMGCRIFFCDPSSTQWQQERYERFQADLKRLHGELQVPYLYMEWRSALELLGLGTSHLPPPLVLRGRVGVGVATNGPANPHPGPPPDYQGRG
jgi:Fe-S-cluster containining protein